MATPNTAANKSTLQQSSHPTQVSQHNINPPSDTLPNLWISIVKIRSQYDTESNANVYKKLTLYCFILKNTSFESYIGIFDFLFMFLQI